MRQVLESEWDILKRYGDFKVTTRCLCTVALAATLLLGCSQSEETYVKPRQFALEQCELGHYTQAEARLIPLIKTMKANHAQSLANATQQLAWVYMCDGKFKEAEDLASKAQFSHDKNDSSDVESRILDAYTLASIYLREGKYAQAEPLFKDAIEMRRQLTKENRPPATDKIVEAPRLAPLELGMAKLEFETGRYKEASNRLQEVVKLAEADRLDNKPGSGVVLAQALLTIAALDEANGKFLDAESIINRVMALKGSGLNGHSSLTLGTMLGLLSVLTAQHRYREADALAQHVWLDMNTLFREDHPDLLRAKLLNMPNVHHMHPEVPNAELQSVHERLIASYADTYGADSPYLIAPYELAGLYSLTIGDYESAESNLRAALALTTKRLGEHHPRTIRVVDDLALTLGFKDLNTKTKTDLAEAKSLARQAIANLNESTPEDNPVRARALGVLASIYMVEGDNEAAYKAFQDYLVVSKKVNYEDPVDRIRFLKNYQTVCEKTGHTAEARRIKALFADTTPVVHASVGKSGKVPLLLK